MELPPLLKVSHIQKILSCGKSKAYEIMHEPHRPRWNHPTLVRIHRDAFLQQLEEESKVEKLA